MKNILNLFKKDNDYNLSKKLIQRLYQIPKERWVDIHHSLNRWQFPLEFYDLIPEWYRDNMSIKRASKLIHPIMNEISKEVNEKEQLRHHNVIHGRMSNLEFEYWFENLRLNKNPSDEIFNSYYNKSNEMEKLEWWKDEIFNQIKHLIREENITNP